MTVTTTRDHTAAKGEVDQKRTAQAVNSQATCLAAARPAWSTKDVHGQGGNKPQRAKAADTTSGMWSLTSRGCWEGTTQTLWERVLLACARDSMSNEHLEQPPEERPISRP